MTSRRCRRSTNCEAGSAGILPASRDGFTPDSVEPDSPGNVAFNESRQDACAPSFAASLLGGRLGDQRCLEIFGEEPNVAPDAVHLVARLRKSMALARIYHKLHR